MSSVPFACTRRDSSTTLQLGGKAVFLLGFAAVVAAVSHASLPEDAWLELSGLVCLTAIAIAFFGNSRARSPRAQESANGERGNWAEIKAAFTQTADSTIADTRSQGGAISVAVFRLSDLPELKAVFGTAAAQQVVATLAQALSTVAPGQGMVMRTDFATFAILLLVPDVDVRSIGASAPAFSELYEDMLLSIEHARAVEARRMRRLRREHESYYTDPSPPPGFPVSTQRGNEPLEVSA